MNQSLDHKLLVNLLNNFGDN